MKITREAQDIAPRVWNGWHILTVAEAGFSMLDMYAHQHGVDIEIMRQFADRINTTNESGSLHPRAPISAVPRHFFRDHYTSNNPQILADFNRHIAEFIAANRARIRAARIVVDFRVSPYPVPEQYLAATEDMFRTIEQDDPIEEILILTCRPLDQLYRDIMTTPRGPRFTEVTNSTQVGRKSAVRAQQAWQFLIAKASDRQIIRYEHLRSIMGYSDDRPLFTILGHIMHLCRSWGLPPLTIIVVNRDGTPGDGFTDVPRDEFDHWREKVFDEDWFSIVPPTIDQFHTAWREATGGAPTDEGA